MAAIDLPRFPFDVMNMGIWLWVKTVLGSHFGW